MEAYRILFNPLSGSGKGKENAEKLNGILSGAKLTYVDMTKISDYEALFDSLEPGEKLVVCGGDGTLNRFVNETYYSDNRPSVYYYATGSGNDFLHDIGNGATVTICIDEYIKDLPTVTVNGKTSRFINGIGYGIDGYCCEVGDALREKSDKPVNYTAIAIKGLLFHYHPTNAIITVDGVAHRYNKVWLAPTMNGRFYGGGMMPTPDQKRFSEDKKVSTMLFFGSGKLKTLCVFPSIFKGEHIKHPEMCTVLTGKEIRVEFDRPTALQIDGETVLGVTGYTVNACDTPAAASAAEESSEAV